MPPRAWLLVCGVGFALGPPGPNLTPLPARATFAVVVTGVRRSLTREWQPLVSAMAQMMRDTDPSYALRYKVRTYASSRRSHRSKLSTSRETAAD